MYAIDDYKTAGEKLYHQLHLATYPVAIKYIKNEDEIPKDATMPSVFGQKIALCQAFRQARSWGMTVAMTAKDNFCTPATAIHKWRPIAILELP